MRCDRGVNVSPHVLTADDFARLRQSATSFWHNFERDEVKLWPM